MLQRRIRTIALGCLLTVPAACAQDQTSFEPPYNPAPIGQGEDIPQEEVTASSAEVAVVDPSSVEESTIPTDTEAPVPEGNGYIDFACSDGGVYSASIHGSDLLRRPSSNVSAHFLEQEGDFQGYVDQYVAPEDTFNSVYAGEGEYVEGYGISYGNADLINVNYAGFFMYVPFDHSFQIHSFRNSPFVDDWDEDLQRLSSEVATAVNLDTGVATITYPAGNGFVKKDLEPGDSVDIDFSTSRAYRHAGEELPEGMPAGMSCEAKYTFFLE